MKFASAVAGSLLLFTMACTPRPDSIAPVSMTGAFDHLSCSMAKEKLTTERLNLAALERKQNNAATADAVGVFLLLVPVSKVTGGDVAGELGASKGAVLALEQRVDRCS